MVGAAGFDTRRQSSSSAEHHTVKTIYLDYNATTPCAREVQEAMLPFLAEYYGNPSSGHVLGRASREAIEDARTQVGLMLGADRTEIVFTSGGTESNNLALKGIAFRGGHPPQGHLVISGIEHPAINEPARFLKNVGWELTVVPCNSQGVVEPEAVAEALRENTRLVSVVHANNEIGTIQPIAEIAEVCHKQGVLVHTDSAQSIGKIEVDVAALGVDLLSVAGHKFYAPKGVGALYVRRGVQLEPLLHGAGHESGQRAGTENTAFIAGLGRAADLVRMNLESSAERMEALRDELWELLREAVGAGLKRNGEGADILPNTLSLRFPGVVGHDMLARVPELCASTAAACHSGDTEISATLAALGLTPEEAQGTVRLSIGRNTTQNEIQRAASLLVGAWEDLK